MSLGGGWRIKRPGTIKFETPEDLIRKFKEIEWIPIPLRIYRIKLRHNKEEFHIAYLFEFGNGDMWLFDSATNFSGTGGRYYQEMEKFLEKLTKIMRSVELKEVEIPYFIYWKLYLFFYKWGERSEG